MSEIIQGLYLGGWHNAQDRNFLKRKNVSHIVIAAGELREVFPTKYFYKHIQALNHDGYRIIDKFDEAADFIEIGLENGSSVLVHCDNGNSRSSALVIAYLMKYREMNFERCHHLIKKNTGAGKIRKAFVYQLKEYWKKLEKHRLTKVHYEAIQAICSPRHTTTVLIEEKSSPIRTLERQIVKEHIPESNTVFRQSSGSRERISTSNNTYYEEARRSPQRIVTSTKYSGYLENSHNHYAERRSPGRTIIEEVRYSPIRSHRYEQHINQDTLNKKKVIVEHTSPKSSFVEEVEYANKHNTEGRRFQSTRYENYRRASPRIIEIESRDLTQRDNIEIAKSTSTIDREELADNKKVSYIDRKYSPNARRIVQRVEKSPEQVETHIERTNQVCRAIPSELVVYGERRETSPGYKHVSFLEKDQSRPDNLSPRNSRHEVQYERRGYNARLSPSPKSTKNPQTSISTSSLLADYQTRVTSLYPVN